jgi:hypothetical protein
MPRLRPFERRGAALLVATLAPADIFAAASPMRSPELAAGKSCRQAPSSREGAMASKIEVGSEVVRNGVPRRMRVLGFSEIGRRPRAWCEWQDEQGVTRSQQFPVHELALAVDRGPVGDPWAAGGL